MDVDPPTVTSPDTAKKTRAGKAERKKTAAKKAAARDAKNAKNANNAKNTANDRNAGTARGGMPELPDTGAARAGGARTPGESEPRSSGGATTTVVDAMIAAALGEAVAESLSAALAESINESFTELMAGGLANALEEALEETVSAAVAQELPGALAAAVADASSRATPAASSSAATVTSRAGRAAPPAAAGREGPPDGHAVELAVARSLWEALPPRRLPVLPNLDLAARRVAATSPERVGGDWFDATAATAEIVLLCVGDVAGHGPSAAALMAELCHAGRAYALLDLPPAQIASRLTDVLRAGGHQSLASACTARLHLPTGQLTWCNAGHPPPVLITSEGDVSFLGDVHGPLLGASTGATPGADAGYAQSTVTLPLGTTVLFYTAGLVDQPDAPIANRLDALAAAAAKACGPAAAAPGGAASDAPPGEGHAARAKVSAERPDQGLRPLAACCDSLLAELAAAKEAAAGRSAGGSRRPTRESDSVLLAARLC